MNSRTPIVGLALLVFLYVASACGQHSPANTPQQSAEAVLEATLPSGNSSPPGGGQPSSRLAASIQHEIARLMSDEMKNYLMLNEQVQSTQWYIEFLGDGRAMSDALGTSVLRAEHLPNTSQIRLLVTVPSGQDALVILEQWLRYYLHRHEDLLSASSANVNTETLQRVWQQHCAEVESLAERLEMYKREFAHSRSEDIEAMEQQLVQLERRRDLTKQRLDHARTATNTEFCELSISSPPTIMAP